MRGHTVLLLALFVLAGCSGAPGLTPDDGVGDTTPTVTPAPVPGTGPGGEMPPGLNGTTVTDPEALATSHAALLESTSYTERADSVVRSPDGTALAGRHLSVEQSPDAYRLGFSLSGERRRESRSYQTVAAAVWSNGSVAVQRITNRANTTEYETVPGGFYREFARPNVRLYAQVLAENDARVVGNESRDGVRHYRLEATVDRVPAAFTVRGSTQVGPATLRATVTGTGLLERVTLSYPAIYGAENATVEHTLVYTELGTTAVTRPAWFDRAVDDAAEPTSTLDVASAGDPNRVPPARLLGARHLPGV